MAETVLIRDTAATAKIRHPVGVFALVLVTIGIYYLVWYYKVNRELRDLGRATGEPERLGTSPLTSLLAITVGWLVVVPPFVSFYRTFRRIRAAQEVSGAEEHVSVALGFILYVVGVFVLPIEVIYAQDELNRVWRSQAPRATVAT
jgi:Ca2+/Na+ antiporter